MYGQDLTLENTSKADNKWPLAAENQLKSKN